MKSPFYANNPLVIISTAFVLFLFLVYISNFSSKSPVPQASITPAPTITSSSSDMQELTPEDDAIIPDFPTPTITLIKHNISFKLPSGWTYKKEIEDIFESYQAQVYKFESGEYKLTVGRGSTGRAYCNITQDRRNYIPLSNSLLGTQVYRDNPSDFTATHLSVCADVLKSGEVEDGTRIGQINYELPDNWTEAKLKEMDQIVESIREK